MPAPSLEPLLYILVIQRIRDRRAYRLVAEREQSLRPTRMRLVHALPSRGGEVCVYLWDAESLETVHHFIRSTYGSIGESECLEVDDAEALGLERVNRACEDVGILLRNPKAIGGGSV